MIDLRSSQCDDPGRKIIQKLRKLLFRGILILQGTVNMIEPRHISQILIRVREVGLVIIFGLCLNRDLRYGRKVQLIPVYYLIIGKIILLRDAPLQKADKVLREHLHKGSQLITDPEYPVEEAPDLRRKEIMPLTEKKEFLTHRIHGIQSLDQRVLGPCLPAAEIPSRPDIRIDLLCLSDEDTDGGFLCIRRLRIGLLPFISMGGDIHRPFVCLPKRLEALRIILRVGVQECLSVGFPDGLFIGCLFYSKYLPYFFLVQGSTPQSYTFSACTIQYSIFRKEAQYQKMY